MFKKIHFKDSAGVKLCGILSGASDNSSNPIMILCHGFTSSKDNLC